MPAQDNVKSLRFVVDVEIPEIFSEELPELIAERIKEQISGHRTNFRLAYTCEVRLVEEVVK